MKKDIRFIQTEKRIKCALIELLGRKKFEHITVNDIVIQGEISRSTFYNHYEDKYELLNYYQHHCVNKINKGFFNNSDQNPKHFLYGMFSFIKNEVIILGLFLSKRGSVAVKNEMVELLRKNTELNVIPRLDVHYKNSRENNILYYSCKIY